MGALERAQGPQCDALALPSLQVLHRHHSESAVARRRLVLFLEAIS